MSQLTINLLPPAYRRREQLDRSFSLATIWVLVPLLVLIAIWLTALTSQRSLADQNQHLQSQIGSNTPAQEYDKLAGQAKSLVGLVSEYQKIYRQGRAWNDLFTYLEGSTPPGVTILGLTTAPDKNSYSVTITGLASSRELVGAFRENLLAYRVALQQPARVTQAVVDSISTDGDQQKFVLKSTFNLALVADKQ